MNEQRENLSYEAFGIGVRELAQVIIDSWEPDIILSIARGGLFLGGALGYALDIKNVSVMNIEFYTGIGERLDAPIVVPPTPDPSDLDGLRVLVADDVSDSGSTFELVHKFLDGHAAEFRTAVLYQKPHSKIVADYYWKSTDKWINFPWSALPPVSRSR